MSEAALKAGVIGHPIGHSLSPQLHGFWLDQYKIDGEYLAFEVMPEDLEDFLRTLPERGRRGTNVTLPHKEGTAKVMDRVDDIAERVGSVNTVVVQDDGNLHGSNTDVFGFLENIWDFQPDWRADAGPAVVLGAGGAARGILVGLQDEKAPEIRLLNRTRERADALAHEFGDEVKVYDWENRAEILSECSTLINTTSLGMVGQAALEISMEKLPESALVTDIVYTPLETDLLKSAKRRGNPVVDGLGMLLHQARPGFSAWFGVEPEVTNDLRAHILNIMASK